jgi:hypothetical protein
LTTIWPAALVASVVVLTTGEVEDVVRLSAAAPWKVSDPTVSAPAVPLPLATTLPAELATVSVLIVPVPSTVPLVSVTAGETGFPLACTNRAPAPLTLMPLLVLMSPLPLRTSAPPVMLVAPV